MKKEGEAMKKCSAFAKDLERTVVEGGKGRMETLGWEERGRERRGMKEKGKEGGKMKQKRGE